MNRHSVVGLWILFFALLVGLLVYGVTAAADEESKTVTFVRVFIYKDGQLPKRDPRHRLVHRAARAIEENSRRYALDPALLAAIIYAESSFDPRAVGFSDGETGVMQVHGRARRQCKMAGLDLTKLEDQVQCGSRWLSLCEARCGSLVRDRVRCLSSRGKDTKSCSGGMAQYITGRCDLTSKKLAWKVFYRFRLARWARNQAQRHLLY